jgi:hypothetical protein
MISLIKRIASSYNNALPQVNSWFGAKLQRNVESYFSAPWYFIVKIGKNA